MDSNNLLRYCNERFNGEHLKMGFSRSKHDYCLYTELLYVDDLLVAGRKLSSKKKLKRDLAMLFEMSDCDELRHFLGY